MNDNLNYYELLGVKNDATEDEIKKAYRNMAKKWHPDVNADSNATMVMDHLNKAKEVLLDADKRKTYDEYLENKPNLRYEKFNKDENIKYNENVRTYTKWEYFKDYLKYYKVNIFRKILACFLVGIETIICGLLQLINLGVVYLIGYMGSLITNLGIILLIVTILLFLNIINNSYTNLTKILLFISSILMILSTSIIFKFLIEKLPIFLEKMNIRLFKFAIGYKK